MAKRAVKPLLLITKYAPTEMSAELPNTKIRKPVCLNSALVLNVFSIRKYDNTDRAKVKMIHSNLSAIQLWFRVSSRRCAPEAT